MKKKSFFWYFVIVSAILVALFLLLDSLIIFLNWASLGAQLNSNPYFGQNFKTIILQNSSVEFIIAILLLISIIGFIKFKPWSYFVLMVLSFIGCAYSSYTAFISIIKYNNLGLGLRIFQLLGSFIFLFLIFFQRKNIEYRRQK